MQTLRKNAVGRTVPLFEATLAYHDGMAPLVQPEAREGVLIGSGQGQIEGERIQGSLRWSMYAADCAYLLVKEGIDPGPGQHLCTVNPAGVIETGDGAAIWFDARGFGLRGVDPDAPHLWVLTMSLRFETEDERYRWMNGLLGSWQGTFDEKSGTARYYAFVPAAA